MENWDDMRVFLSVARTESLTSAARVLQMDPATVGRRIARLEARLGAALFAKSPQGYALTDRGTALAARVSEAETALRAGADTGVSKGMSGQVRIGAPDGCANFLLPPVVARLSVTHPGLEVQILALPRVVSLSKREADLAITVSPPDAGRLTVRKIADYHLHLAQRSDLPVPLRLADLRDLPLVGYIPDMIFDRALDYLDALGPRAAHGVQRASNSVPVQLALLRQGGIGIVHDFALPFAPELRRVLTGALSLRRAFYLVRHEADRRVARIDRIAEALVTGIRAEVARLEDQVAASEIGEQSA